MIRSFQGQLPQFPANCSVDSSARGFVGVTPGERCPAWTNGGLEPSK
jgi:hypothetical protein